MEAEIGEAAGISWQYLEQHGVTTLSKLKQGTKLSDQLLLMALGWLARENKLNLVQQKRSVKISLKAD